MNYMVVWYTGTVKKKRKKRGKKREERKKKEKKKRVGKNERQKKILALSGCSFP